MSTEITQFENKYLATMAAIQNVAKQEKFYADKVKELKAELEVAMDQYEIKSIDNDFLKITRVAESTVKTIDLKALLADEPALYGELLEDYPKVTNRKAYLKFTVK